MKFSKSIFLNVFVILMSTAVFCALPPTVKKTGRFESLNSLLTVNAVIDDKSVTVCLPKLEFKQEIDTGELLQSLNANIKAQEAIFQLYHDGLGSPKKQNGMYFASDVFLKDTNLTYTGYIRKLGYKFSISKKPAFEDPDYLETNDDISEAPKKKELSMQEKLEQAKKEQKEKLEEEVATVRNKSLLRVATVYDVLPAKVIPQSIRNQQAKVASIVSSLKKRPYKTEIIQQDPLRWASGYMGTLNEKGEIDMAKCESQIVDFIIRVPEKKGWLTPEMLKEIESTPCEYILKRYKNGLEVLEGTRYLLQDIYFGKLKLTWSEWLEKHGHKCPEFVEQPEYATGVVPLEIHQVNGVFKALDALSICRINFTEKSNLVYPQEIMRVFPPKPKPEDRNTMLKFLKNFTEAYQGKSICAHIMVCPGGKSYTELGQKRIQRMLFKENNMMFDACEKEILEQLKKQK